jgi:limonene-1,2-epoxide hydrolase
LQRERNDVPAPAFSENPVNIEAFMHGYKAAWEQRDPAMFAALFLPDGQYHNTPFQVQRGTAQLVEYWKRVQLQEDVQVSFEVLARAASSGIAHWHVTYQVASEELFQIWAQSTGTSLVARQPGDPLPRMVLDGVLHASFDGNLCSQARIWWHSMPQPA